MDKNSEICKDFENFDFSEFLPKNIKAVVTFTIPNFDLEFPEIIVKEPIKKIGKVQKDRPKLKNNQNDIF